MSSSVDKKTCGICTGSFATIRCQVMFTSECSHCFHFSCISNYVSHGNRLCPICFTVWKHPPLAHPSFQHSPYEPEPLQFNDDEPLPHPTSNDSHVDVQKVTIRAIPEHPALAASQSATLFSVLVGLKAPSLSDDARLSQRAPVDIITVLDVSGSMSGKKLDLVKRAVHFVIDNLGACDRLSVVSFSDRATRMLPLRLMTDNGREDAKHAVDLLVASGGTNIVDGLTKGTQVLDERRFKNPVTSIIFLSDGNDTYKLRPSFHGIQNSGNGDVFLHLLPPSISPRSQGSEAGGVETFPVHSFGFGSDHDPITMHAISDASGGTFSFIESIEMVQDAFASCIGGLLSVVTQELRLKLRSASHGVEIKSIPSGRYRSEISNQGSEGVINIGDLYADEDRVFLINLSIPPYSNNNENYNEAKTSLLDISCSYRDAVLKQIILIESDDLVEIRRPETPSPQDLAVNLEVDRQRNRLSAAEGIQQAQRMAEAGNLTGAKNLLMKKRSVVMSSASAQAGDGMTKWLEGEMKETELRMESVNMYQQSGRAFALSGMSSHASQRAATRGSMVCGSGASVFGSGAPVGMGYVTPQMANMVGKSQHQQQQQNKGGDENVPMKDYSLL